MTEEQLDEIKLDQYKAKEVKSAAKKLLMPKTNNTSQDVVMTPPDLAQRLVDYFQPSGRLLDPCRGDGAFYNAMLPYSDVVDWHEISEGRDFLEAKVDTPYDWIITGPPFSGEAFRHVLAKSFEAATNVVMLITVSTAVTRARLNLMYEYGFGMKEMIFLDKPATWPHSGFMSGAVHYQKSYDGPMTQTNWSTPSKKKAKNLSTA